MTKPRLRLRLVKEAAQTPQPASMDDKRAAAIAYLRSRKLYVLDQGSPAKWGIPQPGAKK